MRPDPIDAQFPLSEQLRFLASQTREETGRPEDMTPRRYRFLLALADRLDALAAQIGPNAPPARHERTQVLA